MSIRARLAIGAAVLLGIGPGAAIPAAAVSNSTQKKFIAALHHAAPATKHVSTKKLLSLGTGICNILSVGSVSDEVGILSERTNGFHFPKKQVVPIVATSVTYLCPSHKGAVVAYQNHPSTTPPTQSPAPPTTKPPAASSGGLDQQAQIAVQQAKQYLQTDAFSQAGLIAQLDSPNGGGFSVADATAAVDSLNVNWNNEAVQSAKDYMKLEPMSCADLVQQLDSSSGDQYTYAQAVYGAEQAGDCPNGAPTGTTGATGSTGSTGSTGNTP